MATDKPVVGNPLEQFVLLAKSAKGAAAIELIKQALEAPGVYVFGELLDSPNIQELNTGPHASYFKLLNLFAYGTYSDYKAFGISSRIMVANADSMDEESTNASTLPEVSPIMLKKLRHLTVVSLATKSKVNCIPYSILLQELDLKNLRELEDLIIEVIYADIIRGKLDQQNQQLEVDYAIGRDIHPEAIGEIITVLQDWCTSCEAGLAGIESQINKANTNRDTQNKLKAHVEAEVLNIKKTLKTSQQQDGEESMVTDSRDVPAQPDKPSKKSSKTKGLRGSGKFWSKSS